MSGYLDRLIERASGGVTPLPPVAAVVPSKLSLDPLDVVVDPIATHAAPARVTEIVRESATLIERVERVPSAPPAAPQVIEHAVLAPRPSEPVVERQVRPAVLAIETPSAAEMPRAVPVERETESRSVVAAPPIAVAVPPAPQLRIPVTEPEEPTDRWLSPEPPREREVVERVVEPAPVKMLPPTHHVAPPIVPRAPSVGPAAPAATPADDERPVLSIGKLVVEVRNAPAPAPVQTTIVQRIAGPEASPASPSVLHRGFGLGQS